MPKLAVIKVGQLPLVVRNQKWKWNNSNRYFQRSQEIYCWFVSPQAFVISFTSDFIPRLVYQYVYSPDGTLHGFMNHSLSYFNVTDFQPNTNPMEPMVLGHKVEVCRCWQKSFSWPYGSIACCVHYTSSTTNNSLWYSYVCFTAVEFTFLIA